MTKQRRPVTEHKAIALAIGHLSDADIYDATGKSVSLFRQCSDPDLSSHNISFADAARLAGKLVEIGATEQFSEAFRNMVRKFSGHSSHEIDDVDAIVGTMSGCQAIAEAIRASRCPHGPNGHERTDSERDAIIGNAAELIAELQRMIDSLDAERGDTVIPIKSA